MSPNIEQEFFARWPQFFRNRRDYRRSMMGVGFDVRDGWHRLLWDLFTGIDQVLTQCYAGSLPDEFEIVQVKEKFGTLRVYVDGSIPAVDDLIQTATMKSRHICEICGLPGVLFSHCGWWATRCAACAQRAGITPTFDDAGTIQIGRFWLVKSRLVASGTPLENEAKAELDMERLRDVGSKIRTQLTIPVRTDWVDYPRGDIRYDATSKRVVIYADECILESPQLIDEIKGGFNLPPDTEVRTDERYRCPRCTQRQAK